MTRVATIGCLIALVVGGCGEGRPINSVEEGMSRREVREPMGPPDHVEEGCSVWGDFNGSLPKADGAVCFADGHAVLVIGRDK
jgi:hypothetical protein